LIELNFYYFFFTERQFEAFVTQVSHATQESHLLLRELAKVPEGHVETQEF
jgi:hypothetical protein